MRKTCVSLLLLSCFCITGWALDQTYYAGKNVTGELLHVRTVDALAVAQTYRAAAAGRSPAVATPDFKAVRRLQRPAMALLGGGMGLASLTSTVTPTYTLRIDVAPSPVGFSGLSHYDQRMASGGNQYSIEPPSPSIAAGGGYILEGVNNAVQVYTSSGVPLLPRVLSTNELFGVAPAIDRVTGENGPYPTDMRVFYDQTINRWFVLQRAQDYDVSGYPLISSRLYLAVSQTPDPTRAYRIYEMNTTNKFHPGCPCLLDFPQIGADQYGFYISGNEYSTLTETFVSAAILAVSKTSLSSGALAPTAFRFSLPFATGHEFAIQPATTPPGASYFTANGGLEFFLSNNGANSFDNHYSVWAMYNTASLGTASPNLFLTRLAVPGPTYSYPDAANQRPGPVPYGASLFPPRGVAFIDGGDTRVLSLTYAGGRLYATFATQVTDSKGSSRVGGGYAVFSPAFRGGVLTAPVLASGYLAVEGNHLLRPSIAVNPRGQGVIAMTLVGPNYYPAAAYAPFDLATPPAVLRVAALGSAPEDGFTGYQGYPARWGDYSAGVGIQDGSFWIATQYIPFSPRTESANWGTRVVHYVP